MRKTTEGGRVALRGFGYQILYSVLRASYTDISVILAAEEMTAKFVFEGQNEDDLLIAFPTHTEHVQIKTRRAGNRKWSLAELFSVLQKLIAGQERPGDTYTFVTDGHLDESSENLRQICSIISNLKDIDKTTEFILNRLGEFSFSFNSTSSYWGMSALKGTFTDVLPAFAKALRVDQYAVIDILSRFTIVSDYQETHVHRKVFDTLQLYLPAEKIRPAIKRLVADIFELAKTGPVTISRDQLFKNADIPVIPLIEPILRKACLSVSKRNASHNLGFFLRKSVDRPLLEKTFSDFIADSQKRYFILTGGSGVGKSISCIILAFAYAGTIPTIYLNLEGFNQKDPLAEISLSLSEALGRSDSIPIKSLIARMRESVLHRRDTDVLLIADSLDSLHPERSEEIVTLLCQHFEDFNVKLLFTCKNNKLPRCLKSFKTSFTGLASSNCSSSAYIFFELEDYNDQEFLSALRCHGYRVSREDDVGNEKLCRNNPLLHRPLYLSIFSQVCNEKKEQFPPSLGLSLIFEVHFKNVISKTARLLNEPSTKSIESLIWDVIIGIAKKLEKGAPVTFVSLLESLPAVHQNLSHTIKSIVSFLIDSGLLYEFQSTTPRACENPDFDLLYGPPSITFFHAEIALWVTAFEKARDIISGQLHMESIIDLSNTDNSVLMAFGILCRCDRKRYEHLILDVIKNKQDPFKILDLMSYLDTPRPDFAIVMIKEIRKYNRNFAFQLQALGGLYLERGIECNAISLYKAASDSFEVALVITRNLGSNNLGHIKYNNSMASILNNCALSYQYQGKMDLAMSYYSNCIKMMPNWQCYHNLAIIEKDAENYTRAVELFDKTLEFKSEMAPGRVLMTLNSKAICIFRNKDLDEANKIWSEIIRSPYFLTLHNHAICQIYSNMGDCLFRQFEIEKAIDCFREAMVIDEIFEFKTTKESLIYMIAGYIKLGNLELANSFLHSYVQFLDKDLVRQTLSRYDITEYSPVFASCGNIRGTLQ